MSNVPMITPHSITGVKGLEKRPVYFVNLNGSPTPNLVVKGEVDKGNLSGKDLEVSISWASKLMKNVQNSQVNSKLMNPGEVQVFKAAVQHVYAKTSKQFDFAFGAFPCKWVKMPYVSGLSDADFRKDIEVKSSLGDTSYTTAVFDMKRFKETIKSFSEDAVWRELGKVVAVDIFNGNNDRFNLSTGAWSNFGNVMFLNGGQTRVIGLDTFDPESGSTTSNLNQRGSVFPELRILVDAQKRLEFAAKCTQSVGDVLLLWVRDSGATSIKLTVDGQAGKGVMEIPCSLLPKLFVPFTEPFNQGLTQGAAELKLYLQAKVRQYAAPAMAAAAAPRGFGPGAHRNPPPRPIAPTPGVRPATTAPMQRIPQGIADRMRYLGW